MLNRFEFILWLQESSEIFIRLRKALRNIHGFHEVFESFL